MKNPYKQVQYYKPRLIISNCSEYESHFVRLPHSVSILIKYTSDSIDNLTISYSCENSDASETVDRTDYFGDDYRTSHMIVRLLSTCLWVKGSVWVVTQADAPAHAMSLYET